MEYFPLINEQGDVIGRASRAECHSGTFWLHPVVHLHVFNSRGELYLQQRSLSKDVQPGKWDTSVGGHVDYGESIEQGLQREVREELGMTDYEATFVTKYRYDSTTESEMVHVFRTVYDGAIVPDPVEIKQGRFWSVEEIRANMGKNLFTPNFEQEFERIIAPTLLSFQEKTSCN